MASGSARIAIAAPRERDWGRPPPRDRENASGSLDTRDNGEKVARGGLGPSAFGRSRVKGQEMSKKDWLTVGLKLIGVFFAVLGFTTLCITIINVVVQFLQLVDRSVVVVASGYVTLVGLLQPIAYLLASYVLVKKTDWCLNKIVVAAEQNSSEQLTQRDD